MADDRRIIFGIHVVPKETGDVEETIDSQAKTIIMQTDTAGTAMNKTFGGKGICTDINATQFSDSWTSMAHSQMYWEDWADATDGSGNRWEDTNDYWSGERSVTTGNDAANTHLAPQAVDESLAFCYIKNTGDNDLKVCLNGNGASSGNYNLRIIAGGSMAWRGGNETGNGAYADDIHVKATGGTTTIEYIIAIK